MKKLIIISLIIIMTGCAYKVVHLCDPSRATNQCFYQAVMPWQEVPEPFNLDGDKLTISDEECLMILNIVAKHNDQSLLEAPQSCNK